MVGKRHFQTHLCQLWGLTELRQVADTHDNASDRSRSDRLYLNQDLAEQLDRVQVCSPLEWVPHLSAHRTLIFACLLPSRSPDARRPLDPALLQAPCWPERVAVRFRELSQLGSDPADGFRRLHLLEEAMWAASAEMAVERQSCVAQATDPDDHLSWTMRFIRVAESGRRGALEAYPERATLAPDSPALAALGGLGLQPFRAHAVRLAREAAVRQLEAVRAASELSEAEQQHGRNSTHRLLSRFELGKCFAVLGVSNAAGEILTEFAEMAAALREHCAQYSTPAQTMPFCCGTGSTLTALFGRTTRHRPRRMLGACAVRMSRGRLRLPPPHRRGRTVFRFAHGNAWAIWVWTPCGPFSRL